MKFFLLLMLLLPSTLHAQVVIGPTDAVTVFAKGARTEGTKEVAAPVTLDDASRDISFNVDRSSYTDTSAKILMTVEYSGDGKTWVFLCSAIALGGVLKDEKGVVLPFSSVTCTNLKATPNRQIRTSIEVLKGTANIAAEIETK